MTLSLYREGPHGEQLASRRFRTLPTTPGFRCGSPRRSRREPTTWRCPSPRARRAGGATRRRSGRAAAPSPMASPPTAAGHCASRSLTTGPCAVRDFFTFRKPQPDYFRGPTGPDMWSWLEVYPQHVFRNSQGREGADVGRRRAERRGRPAGLAERSRVRAAAASTTGPTTRGPDAVNDGLNVAEQWERALKEDPRFIFITGWNEWIAGRFDEFAGVPRAGDVRRPVRPGAQPRHRADEGRPRRQLLLPDGLVHPALQGRARAAAASGRRERSRSTAISTTGRRSRPSIATTSATPCTATIPAGTRSRAT